MDIRIEGDPTTWRLRTPIDAGQLTAPGGPAVLEVSEPLAGRLLLSPRAVGSVVLFQPPAADPHHGVVPNGVRLPEEARCLYVPSTTGPDLHSNPPRYYLLPPFTDLEVLEAEITTAMSGGTVTVDFTGPADPGVIVLNGAALSFVVLCPRTSGS
jgi:hypothetical protein